MDNFYKDLLINVNKYQISVYICTINNKKMKYSTYILTAFDTEIERFFNNKKEMINYLATDLFASKDSGSISIVAFSIDKDGDKTFLNTKYSREGR